MRAALLLALGLSACQPEAPAPGAPPEPVVQELADDDDASWDADDDDVTPPPADPEEYDDGYGGSGGDEQDCEDAPALPGDPLAAPGDCGRLVYAPYAPRGRDEAVDRLPDFSFAGFEGGGVALPEVEAAVTLWPEPGDDTERIQAAIDAVSALPEGEDGFRGAVLLAAGDYACADSLRIEASGVVLRGEGQGEDGTVIVATGQRQYAVIEVVGGRGPDPVGAPVAITDGYVPVGARTFAVDDADGFAVGDPVAVVRTPDQGWVDDLGMGVEDLGPDEHWSPGSFVTAHERTITAIEGDVVTVDIPLVDSLAAEHGGGELALLDGGERIDHVGVEDLRLDSEYDGPQDEEHASYAVWLEHAQDAWVQRVTVVHVGRSAVSVHGSSRFVTVQDVAMLDPISPISGGNRYAFEVSGGLGVLFQRCYARGGRHSFVTGSRVTGPHAWLDCLAEEVHADDGPHHKWATGLLFDRVSTAQLRVQNRAWSGGGHGWSGAQVMFWNGEVSEEFVSDAPPGAMNWVVGVVGPEGDGQMVPGEPPGIQESLGAPVLPRSLYLQQLADRLGDGAVAQITTEAQRSGSLWDDLADWADAGAPTPPENR